MIVALLSLSALAGEPNPAATPVPVAPVAVADAPTSVPIAGPIGPDRSKPPVVVPPVILGLPEPEAHTIGNAKVMYVPVKGLRKVEIHVILDRGAIDLAGGMPDDLSDATGYLWDAATTQLSADQLAEIETLYDLDASSWMGQLASGIDLSVPLDELDRGIDLLKGVLREPTFPKTEVKRYINDQILQYTTEAVNDSRTIASQALSWAWFPADHPYGARPNLKAIKKLKSPAMLAMHDRILAEAPMTVVVVGDVPWATLEPKLTPVLAGLGQPGSVNPDPAFTPPAGSRLLAIDVPGSPQATLRMRMAAPLRDDPERATAEVIDFVLGGSFLSRLNSNLREEKGWTYGCYSNYFWGATRAHWTVSVDVKVEHVGETLAEITKEVDKVASEGVRGDEIVGARNSNVGWWNSTLETSGGAAGFYDSLHFNAATVAHERGLLEAIDKVSAVDTQRVASKWFGADKPRVWVIVGDRKQIEPQIASFGLQPEWITAEDAVLGTF